MKMRIEIDVEDRFDKEAILDAVKNKLKLESVYDEVFRRVIKYSQDEKEVEAYSLVWEKLNEYLMED